MKLTGVDLNLLVALDALIAERSVTRAADRLGLSQPGMSNALARLRKLFGDPLLVREGLTLVPTPRAEALRQPVQEALSLIEHALDDRPGFDPATDQATFIVSCSDYSLLMLIGPLVRRLAAEAPGLTIQVLPRAPDAVRLLRDGEADLVIEPVEIMPDAGLPSLRLFADRWLCCVWDGNSEVGDSMTMETYLRLGHLVYSGVRGHPISLVDTHLAAAKVPRRIEFTVEEFPARPVPAAGHRSRDRGARARGQPPPPDRRRPLSRASPPPALDHRDAVVEPAPHPGSRPRVAPRPHRGDRRRTRPSRPTGPTPSRDPGDRDPRDRKDIVMGARWRIPAGLHSASIRLPVEGELPSFGGRDRVAQFAAADAGRAAREGRPGRLLDLYLHQLATPASLCPRLGREILRPGAGRDRRAHPRVRVRAQRRQRPAGRAGHEDRLPGRDR